jgi:recyclin-1
MSTLENTFEDIDFDDQPVPQARERSLMDFDDMPLPSRALPTGNAKPSGFFAFSPPRAQGLTGSGYLSKDTSSTKPSASSASYEKYKSHHLSLVPLCKHLRSSASPSATLAMLFPPSPHPPSIQAQSKLLLSLIRFLSSAVQPLRDWGFLRQALLAAVDRFDSACLVTFETADSKKDEEGMKEASLASWAVWNGGGGRRDEWECGRVWVEKREILYEGAKWDPLANIV